MRLTLRKRLKPFRNLTELAEALDLTVPALKRKIRKLEAKGLLSVSSLAGGLRPQQIEEDTFELFHNAERCLVCGDEMLPPPSSREIGWGEFKQCPTCDFSAHEMANYKTRKRAALEQLAQMISQSQKTEAVLRSRIEQSERLGR
jgi:hypothetical protein